MCLGDHVHDLGEHGLRTHTPRLHDKATRLVERATRDRIAGRLLHWKSFTGQHGFIDRGAPFNNHTVDRDGVARANTQLVAGQNLIEGNFFIAPIRAHAQRGLWREIKQCPDGPASSLARA